MTEKQKQLYEYYTHIGIVSGSECDDIKRELSNPDISFERYDELSGKLEQAQRRIRWASHRREEVKNAQSRYEEYLRKAFEIKETYGF